MIFNCFQLFFNCFARILLLIELLIMNFLKDLESVRKSPAYDTIKKRLVQFASFSRKSNREWFSELCFCLLTANSKAKTAIAIQKDLGVKGFCEYSSDDVRDCIIKHKHRFHNNKTKFIMGAREHMDIKSVITKIVEDDGEVAAREWLVKNIKGLGYKESSHFMRNVGYTKLAILDRHILRFMYENRLIKEIPKTLTRKIYLDIEEKFNSLAKKLGMNSAELDLVMWYLKTDEILK